MSYPEDTMKLSEHVNVTGPAWALDAIRSVWEASGRLLRFEATGEVPINAPTQTLKRHSEIEEAAREVACMAHVMRETLNDRHSGIRPYIEERMNDRIGAALERLCDLLDPGREKDGPEAES